MRIFRLCAIGLLAGAVLAGEAAAETIKVGIIAPMSGTFAYIGLVVSFVFLFTDEARRTVPDRIAGTIILRDPNNVLDPRGPRLQ